MPVFTYKARAKDGRKIEGRIEAVDRRAAALAVERLGHIPLAVTENQTAAQTASRGAWPVRRRMSPTASWRRFS